MIKLNDPKAVLFKLLKQDNHCLVGEEEALKYDNMYLVTIKDVLQNTLEMSDQTVGRWFAELLNKEFVNLSEDLRSFLFYNIPNEKKIMLFRIFIEHNELMSDNEVNLYLNLFKESTPLLYKRATDKIGGLIAPSTHRNHSGKFFRRTSSS